MTFVVLDDDAGFRVALADNLRDDGYRVEEFASMPDLAVLQRLGRIDAVFAHYHLPQANGIELADRLHAIYPHLPVIVLTADSSAAIDAAVTRRPFTSLQRKPLEYGDVRKLVEQIRLGAMSHSRLATSRLANRAVET
jgi:two-component system nitrogen regulation response regulator GlnG